MRPRPPSIAAATLSIASISLLLACPMMGWAQTPETLSAAPLTSSSFDPTAINTFLSEEDPLSYADSSVGYIDSAIPATQIRLRYDSAYDNSSPTRSEFLWAWAQPVGPGWPTPERRVDDQVASLYLEGALTPRLSAFIEGAVNWVNPEVNANASGIGDLRLGGKYAMIYTDDVVLTAQLKVFAPTGYSQDGIGVGHTSIEPALLGYFRLTDRLVAEAEAHYWQPISATVDRAGPVARYGVGLGYTLVERDNWRLTPIAEFVGWTVISGADQQPLSNGTVDVVNSRGDTIVNGKFGARLAMGDHYQHQIYAGYGQALTSDAWYQNIVRLEYRYLFGPKRNKCSTPCRSCGCP